MVIAPTKNPCFSAEGNTRKDRHRHDRLELRQHEEDSAACNVQRDQNGNEHQLARLRLPALENQEKRQHTFEQNEQRNEIVPLPAEAVHADEQRQRNEQEDQKRCDDCPLFQLSFFNRRLNQIIRPVRFSSNGQREHEQREKQNAVESELVTSKTCQPARVNKLCEVCHANGLHDQRQRRDTGYGGKRLAPDREFFSVLGIPSPAQAECAGTPAAPVPARPRRRRPRLRLRA